MGLNVPPEIEVWGEHGLKGLGLGVAWRLGLRAISAWRDVARERIEADKAEAHLARTERTDERAERQALAQGIGAMTGGLAELSGAVRAMDTWFRRHARRAKRTETLGGSHG